MNTADARDPIVVGVDGSAASAGALRWAVAEAEATGRDVEVVTAWSYTLALDPGALAGSVSAHCLRHATCPVVIVPARPSAHGKSGPSLADVSSLPGPMV